MAKAQYLDDKLEPADSSLWAAWHWENKFMVSVVPGISKDFV